MVMKSMRLRVELSNRVVFGRSPSFATLVSCAADCETAASRPATPFLVTDSSLAKLFRPSTAGCRGENKPCLTMCPFRWGICYLIAGPDRSGIIFNVRQSFGPHYIGTPTYIGTPYTCHLHGKTGKLALTCLETTAQHSAAPQTAMRLVGASASL